MVEENSVRIASEGFYTSRDGIFLPFNPLDLPKIQWNLSKGREIILPNANNEGNRERKAIFANYAVGVLVDSDEEKYN